MSAPREGMHLAKEAQKATEVMQDGVYTGVQQTEGIQGGAGAGQFQRKFLARDPRDDYMNTKFQMMDSEGKTPFGYTFFDKEDARWLERKAAVAEAANFDAYFNKEFNKNDLASRQFAQRINPDFYTSREQEMKKRTEVVLKLKGIQLRGPQSKEDLYMLWLIESGRVKLPADWDRIAPKFDGSEEDLKRWKERTYPEGLIRFPLFLSNKQRESRASANNTYGAWGSARQGTNTFSNGQPNAGMFVNNAPLARSNAANGTLGKGFLSYLGESNTAGF